MSARTRPRTSALSAARSAAWLAPAARGTPAIRGIPVLLEGVADLVLGRADVAKESSLITDAIALADRPDVLTRAARHPRPAELASAGRRVDPEPATPARPGVPMLSRGASRHGSARAVRRHVDDPALDWRVAVRQPIFGGEHTGYLRSPPASGQRDRALRRSSALCRRVVGNLVTFTPAWSCSTAALDGLPSAC